MYLHRRGGFSGPSLYSRRVSTNYPSFRFSNHPSLNTPPIENFTLEEIAARKEGKIPESAFKKNK